MPTLDPPNTLLRTALFTLLAGAGWAAAAALLIFLCSRFLPPRLALGSIWGAWRKKAVWWVLWTVGSLAATGYTSHVICQSIAYRDLYWLGRTSDIWTIALLGGYCGYLLMTLVFIVIAMAARRRTAPATPAPARHTKA